MFSLVGEVAAEWCVVNNCAGWFSLVGGLYLVGAWCYCIIVLGGLCRGEFRVDLKLWEWTSGALGQACPRLCLVVRGFEVYWLLRDFFGKDEEGAPVDYFSTNVCIIGIS